MNGDLDINHLRQGLLHGHNLIFPNAPGICEKLKRISRELGYSFRAIRACTWNPSRADALVQPNSWTRHTDARPTERSRLVIVFFYDLNRASRKVLIAIRKLAKYRSLSGQRLPWIQAVVGAMDSTDTAGASRAEALLGDAFKDEAWGMSNHDGHPDRAKFVERFGPEVGNAAVDWHELDLSPEQRQQISSKRLSRIAELVKEGLDPGFFTRAYGPGLGPMIFDWPLQSLVTRARRYESAVKDEPESAKAPEDPIAKIEHMMIRIICAVLIALTGWQLITAKVKSMKQEHPVPPKTLKAGG